MADRSILFSNFNSPDAENPGDFEATYNEKQIERALERKVQEFQRKIDAAREKFEENKQIQSDRFETNKTLTELLASNPQEYFSSISVDLKKQDEAEFERMKDLLDTNLSAFIKESETKLKQEQDDIKRQLIDNQKDHQKTHDALMKSKEAASKQQDYYGSNPKLYAKLYTIQQQAKAEDSGDKKDGTSSMIIQSDKGELGLAIQKQMDGSPAFFAIRDGKVTFPDRPISADQMKDLLYFLYMRGIKDFELPPNIDPNLKETFEQAQAARAEEEANRPNPDTRPYEEQREEPRVENTIDGEDEMPEVAADASKEQWLNNSDELKPEKAKDKEKKKEGYSKAIDEMHKWLQKSKGKVKGESYFATEHADNLRDFVHLRGWTVFSVYPNRNPDNYKLDGKRDKNGNINETYSYRIMIKPDGKGGIKVGYAMPKGAKVTDDVADKVVALQKSQGNKYIRFPVGLSDDDTGVFRLACARAGVIPRGININEHHAKKMIDAAAGTLSDEEFTEFKYRLALQLEQNTNGNPKARQATKIAELKGEYFFKPFKDNFDDVLKPALQDAISGKEADKVIGASRAIQEIYSLYEQASQGAMGDMLKMMSQEDRQAFLAKMQQGGIEFDAEKSVREMPKDYMKAMYDVLSDKHSKAAVKEMEEEFARRRVNDKDAKSYDVTKDMIDDETAKLRQMSDNLEKDHYIPGLRVPYLGKPQHNYSNEQTNTHQQGDNNHQQNNQNNPRRGGGRE